jgi:S-adenosylmethionine synthetase
MYLTVLGTSAEGGDSGQVGRGNRVNGVIALNRPISTEAAAGKKPSAQLVLEQGVVLADIRSAVESVIADQLASITDFTGRLVRGEWMVW